MTIKEMQKLLETAEGFKDKVAHFAFPEEEAPPLPFICFLSPREDTFYADGEAYFNTAQYIVELYTKFREPKTETVLEKTLTEQGICFTKENVYLADEKCYETIYEMEV